MPDTRRDNPDASPIAEGGSSYEMRALPVAAQIAPENLLATGTPDPGHGEDGGEAHDIARASTLQTKSPSECDGDKNWNALENVVVPQDPEENQGGFTAASGSTPITGQGPPSFAQSEFHTVKLILIHTAVALVIELPVHIDCPSSTP
jgi:hypothetical protein